jgi:hypothetical protein
MAIEPERQGDLRLIQVIGDPRSHRLNLGGLPGIQREFFRFDHKAAERRKEIRNLQIDMFRTFIGETQMDHDWWRAIGSGTPDVCDLVLIDAVGNRGGVAIAATAASMMMSAATTTLSAPHVHAASAMAISTSGIAPITFSGVAETRAGLQFSEDAAVKESFLAGQRDNRAPRGRGSVGVFDRLVVAGATGGHQ